MDRRNNFTIRCTACGTKNRIPAVRINDRGKCGKCGTPLETDALSVNYPIMVTDVDFETKVLNSPLPVLLFCWAPWCSTCSAVTPIIHDFAKDARGRVRVAKINVETSPMFSSRFNVTSVPSIFVFDNGRFKESFPGALPKSEIMLKMARYI